VPGLDEVLDAGLPEFSFNVIAESLGSGKTRSLLTNDKAECLLPTGRGPASPR
jgi:hypothetical protein